MIKQPNDPNQPQSKDQKQSSSYKIKKTADEKVLQKLLVENPNQITGSSFHSNTATSVGGDKKFYRRNQPGHPYSDRKNSPSSILSKIEDSPIQQGKDFLHNFGAFSTFGDQFTGREIDPESQFTTPTTNFERSFAKKNLDDAILNHKTKAVHLLVNTFNSEEKKIDLQTMVIDKNQLSANYPCLIIRLKDDYLYHKQMNKSVFEHFYPEFISHLLIACINFKLYDKKVGVYFESRQSFGFLTPTISDVGSAVRLSLGLVPNDSWMVCVINGIRLFDLCLDEFWKNLKKNNQLVKINTFFKNFEKGNTQECAYKLFLMALLKMKDVAALPGMNGKKSIFSLLNVLNSDQFDAILTQVKTENFFSNYVTTIYNSLNSNPSDEFNKLFNQIILIYDRLIKADTSKEKDKNLLGLSEKIELLNARINRYKEISLVETSELDEIPLTSDSPNEKDDSESNEELLQGKYYTPSGMTALFAPLLSYYDLFQKVKLPVRFYVERYAYFELENWSAKKLYDNKIVKINDKDHCDIIYVDNNPCVNRSEAPISTLTVIDELNKKETWIYSEQIKMLIVDVTSSTQEQIKTILTAWGKSCIHLLCFAQSGLKNRQLGLDMAQYGENRVYINEEYLNTLSAYDAPKAETLRQQADALCDILKKLTQGSSSVYATHVRRQMRDSLIETPAPSM